MDAIKYVHAANLNLGAPFSGLDKLEDARMERTLSQAACGALKRLVELCAAEKPDFVTISGGMYDPASGGIKVQTVLRDACAELGGLGIPVFLTHGSRDPLSSRLAALKWPDNTVIFGGSPSRHVLQKNGETIAVVHGISHARPGESRNLAAMLKRDPAFDCFQLGLLRCSVDVQTASDRVAPCSLADLNASGLDAWALGDARGLEILQKEPFIAYPGSMQGLSVNECGPGGCLVVEAAKNGDKWLCGAEFKPLNSIQWEKLAVDLAGVEDPDQAAAKIEEQAAKAVSSAPPLLEGLIARIVLTGSPGLSDKLSTPAIQKELLERLARFSVNSPALWIKDIIVKPRSSGEAGDYARKGGLLGAAAGGVLKLSSDPALLSSFMAKTLAPLYDDSGAAGVPPLSPARGAEILEHADRLCRQALERE